MLIIKQHRIFSQDLRANPNVLYIFGDNLDRMGLGGQAREMRGNHNAFGIATKRSITHNYPADFFFDNQDDVIPIITNEFLRLMNHVEDMKSKGKPYKAIIIPLDGIGTGLSRLPETAPEALKYINYQLNRLETL